MYMRMCVPMSSEVAHPTGGCFFCVCACLCTWLFMRVRVHACVFMWATRGRRQVRGCGPPQSYTCV